MGFLDMAVLVEAYPHESMRAMNCSIADWNRMGGRWTCKLKTAGGGASSRAMHVTVGVLDKELVQSFVGPTNVSLKRFQLQEPAQVDNSTSAGITRNTSRITSSTTRTTGTATRTTSTTIRTTRTTTRTSRCLILSKYGLMLFMQ